MSYGLDDLAPQVKASDADRDAALASLSEHFQAGRLTSAELEERTGLALGARTFGELRRLMADLPAESLSPSRAAPAGAQNWYRAQVPIVTVVTACVIAVIVVIATIGHQLVHTWWILFVALLIARRMATAPSRHRRP